MLVATAGHIDHGKTALIRALTGVETDRLPEEQARGISIDLGFAYWTPDGGRTIGFVDVPGHHGFVRNMLAGVGGVDFALVVVAADDGVMPQTVEHVQILDLLGIGRGLVAITKCDRSTAERINEVGEQVAALLAPTGLAGAPINRISSVTGAGVAELGEALRAAAAEESRAVEGRNFRLAVDRAFTVTGVGTVVTGTVLDGAITVGARLVVSPRGLPVRVRGMQSAGRQVTGIRAGERCALNLAGIEVAEVDRGDWLLAPEMHSPTARIEARLRIVAADALKHHSPVHLHLGTADIPARVLIPRQRSMKAGEDAIVQLALDHPSSAVTGDRFVLRDQSGRALVGGGRVVDPYVSRDRRKQANRSAISAAMELGGAEAALDALLAIPGHEVDTIRFERSFNLEAGAAQEIYRRLDVSLLGRNQGIALPAVRVAAIGGQVGETLGAFHRDHPEAGGMTARELKAALSEPISADAFAAVLKDLAEKAIVEQAGSLVRLAGHKASFSPAENALWQDLLACAEERGPLPLDIRELVGELRTTETAVRTLLSRRRAAGEIWRITEERWMLHDRVAWLAAKAAALAQEVGGDGFTAAQYRDAVGTGRTWAIHILEFFDAIGVTARRGDLRKVQADYERIVGVASAVS